MFTIAAVILITAAAWLANRDNSKERGGYEHSQDNWVLLLHLRQDMKLVAFLLGAAIIMLGIVADRI